MELSAFAHLSRRNIKVIQPGLVYVIEWHAGESSSTSTSASTSASGSSSSNTTSKPQTSQDQDPHPERRRSKRTQRPPVSSSNPSQDESKQIVKIGTGKHGYYVYEEISDSDDDDDDEVEETLKRNDEDDEGGEEISERESGGDNVYVAYVLFLFRRTCGSQDR